MGLRNVTIARQNRLMLDEGGAVPEYEYALEQWWAKVKVIGRHSTYVSAFPLPGSRGADDPENVAILRTRIDWLDKLGFNHAVQTMLAQHVYERFYAIESRHELLAMIEALYGTIRHWNPDNYRPIFLNQAIARFHRLLDFHFERLRLGPEEGMAVPPDRPMTFGRS